MVKAQDKARKKAKTEMGEKSPADGGGKKNAASANHRLDGIGLLQDLPAKTFRHLEKKCAWFEYAPDEVLIEQADKSLDVSFIVSGSVRVTLYEEGDREVYLAELNAGDHFGEMAAVSGLERSAWVVAKDHCLIASLQRNDFLDLMQDSPKVALRLLDRFAAIIRTQNARVTELSVLNPRQRIYTELLRLAAPNSVGDGSWVIDVLPAHNEIASWAGTDKQEIAVAIGALARDRIVERRSNVGGLKTLLIRDHAKLRMLASM